MNKTGSKSRHKPTDENNGRKVVEYIFLIISIFLKLEIIFLFY